jgi:hypothetical protein
LGVHKGSVGGFKLILIIESKILEEKPLEM